MSDNYDILRGDYFLEGGGMKKKIQFNETKNPNLVKMMSGYMLFFNTYLLLSNLSTSLFLTK